MKKRKREELESEFKEGDYDVKEECGLKRRCCDESEEEEFMIEEFY